MKSLTDTQKHGFTLLEVLLVLAIIGALASIALPYYMASREKAKAVSCQSNRRHIEQAEEASYLANSTPSLTIDEKCLRYRFGPQPEKRSVRKGPASPHQAVL